MDISGKEIINNPDLKSLMRKTSEFSFTFFMWALWVYFCLPILNILLWAFGWHLFYQEIVVGRIYYEIKDLIWEVGSFVLLVFLLLRVWGYYNYYKFGRLKRRRHSPGVTVKQLAEDLQVSEDMVRELQSERIINWKIESVDNLPPG